MHGVGFRGVLREAPDTTDFAGNPAIRIPDILYSISGQPNLQCFPSGGHYHGGGRKILVVLFFVLVMMVMVVVGVEMGIALGGGWPS